MLPVMVVVLLIYVVLATLGHFLFHGSFNDCQLMLAAVTDPVDKWTCLDSGGIWGNVLSHFDDFSSALISVFHMSTTAGWAEVMYRGINNQGRD